MVFSLKLQHRNQRYGSDTSKIQLKDAIEDEDSSQNTPLQQIVETQDSTIEMTESLVQNGQSEMEHEVLSPSVNDMSNEVVEELPIEESEKPSEESRDN